MSKRLELIAALVPDGIGVCDVGTDHGYIPLMLLERGYKGAVIGTDINKGPLQKARLSLSDAEGGAAAELMLCDGLDDVELGRIDTVVIAGMGGDTITGILDRATDRDALDKRLILQPATKPEILRYWLTNNEYTITEELYISENGFVYQIICAEKLGNQRLCDAELFVGRFCNLRKSELRGEVLSAHIKRFEAAAKGLDSAQKPELKAWKELICGMLAELRKEEKYDNC